MAVFWVGAPCSLVFAACIIRVIALMMDSANTRLHGAATQKTAIFIHTLRRENLKSQFYYSLTAYVQ
jgi:hypothetical protein